jgi:hypothetical protein
MTGPDDKTDTTGSAREAGTKGESRVRPLRLSTILASLAEEALPQPPDPAGAQAPQPPRRWSRPHVDSNISMGEIVDRTAHAGFGFLAAFLALVAIPLAGVSLPFGFAIAFLGCQMIAGKNRPWLPARLRRHLVAMSTLDWLSARVTRWTAGMERFIKPRLVFLTRGPLWGSIGFGLILQGVGLALPIPIPFSNQIFIIPIMVYAIGMLEDDGVLILIGHMATAIMAVLGVIFWEIVRDGLSHAVAWVVHLF